MVMSNEKLRDLVNKAKKRILAKTDELEAACDTWNGLVEEIEEEFERLDDVIYPYLEAQPQEWQDSPAGKKIWAWRCMVGSGVDLEKITFDLGTVIDPVPELPELYG